MQPQPFPGGSTVRRDAGLYGYERALRRAGIEPDRRRRRGRPRRLRRTAGRRRGDPARRARPASSPASPTPSCSPRRPASAATPRSLRRALAWSVVVDRRTRSATGSACTSPTSRRCAGRSPGSTCGRRTSSPTGSRSTASSVPGLAVWKGDRVAACIAAASVLAKVTRDRIMAELDAELAGVRLQDPQGLHHRRAHEPRSTEHGPCPVHRMRFVNVRRAAGLEPPLEPATSVGPEHVDRARPRRTR